MTAAAEPDWTKDFGLESRQPPRFFSDKGDLVAGTPQAHLLRRAFDDLGVDGVLCANHSPLVYFKQVKRITAEGVAQLQRLFWNHGGAPVLVLISDDQVHIYSGMTRPTPGPSRGADLPSLVETLDRIATVLREFLISVESGEYFRRYPKSFNPAHRVDRELLENLKNTREQLDAAMGPRILPEPLTRFCAAWSLPAISSTVR